MTSEQVVADSASTSTRLLSDARAWDQEAWRQIVRRYGPLVYRWSRRWPLQAADRADLFQEVFRSVAIGLDRFRRDRPGDSFRGWLWTVTRNRAADLLRQRQRCPDIPGGSWDLGEVTSPDSPSDASDACPRNTRVRQALRSIRSDFQERTWRAFWETVVEQRPAAEVAAEIGISPNAVYQARSRVLARLRQQLLADS